MKHRHLLNYVFVLVFLARLRTSGQAAWMSLGCSKREVEWTFSFAVLRLFPESSPSEGADFLSMRHVETSSGEKIK